MKRMHFHDSKLGFVKTLQFHSFRGDSFHVKLGKGVLPLKSRNRRPPGNRTPSPGDKGIDEFHR